MVVAAYWHPDQGGGRGRATWTLYSGGRLEFGIGSGAYQREFDRMHPGLQRNDAFQYMFEMLPVVKALWQGRPRARGRVLVVPGRDLGAEAAAEAPSARSGSRPRSPDTYDFAVKEECNILSWPLTRPMSEVEAYKGRMESALADNPGKAAADLRHHCATPWCTTLRRSGRCR